MNLLQFRSKMKEEGGTSVEVPVHTASGGE
jgi:hypothetical protein